MKTRTKILIAVLITIILLQFLVIAALSINLAQDDSGYMRFRKSIGY